jgi:fucose permease
MALFSGAIFICFILSITVGIHLAVLLLPLSGLFMSVIYPTINSKGISCFPKTSHGAVAGVILFFTAAGAAVGPLIMGAVSDAFGKNPLAGFTIATIFAGLLFAGALINLIYSPTTARLKKLEETEY